MLKGVIREPEEVNAVGANNYPWLHLPKSQPRMEEPPQFLMEEPKPTSTKSTTTTTNNPNKIQIPIDLQCSPNFQNQPQGGYPKKDPMESQLASVQASLQQFLQFQTNQSQNFAQLQQFQAFPTKSKFASE